MTAWGPPSTGSTSAHRSSPSSTVPIARRSSSAAGREIARGSRPLGVSSWSGIRLAFDSNLLLLLFHALLVRGGELVVRELLDPLEVLHEMLLRRRREEAVEFPVLPDCVEEEPAPDQEREESESPHPEVVDRKSTRLN